MYPYFLPIVQTRRMQGKDVLEIGLGYGSLGQQIIQSGARYTGLDIAPNAVKMMNLRLTMQGFSDSAVLGSTWICLFPPTRSISSFRLVVFTIPAMSSVASTKLIECFGPVELFLSWFITSFPSPMAKLAYQHIQGASASLEPTAQ